MRRSLRVVAPVVLALAGAPAAVAKAPPVLRTVSSAGCAEPGATWRMSYVLFWRTAAGVQVETDNRDELLDEAQAFADIVGRNTACNLAMQVDVYDMGRRPFTGWSSADDYRFGKLPRALRAGYDSIMVRAPSSGKEDYAGITYPDYLETFIPADPEAVYQPWEGLILHEWLHIAVWWYVPQQGWPTHDVHGSWDYPQYADDDTDLPYFAAMMSGTVAEPDGSHTGILPAEWSYQGTPKHPRHQDSGAVVLVKRDGRLVLRAAKGVEPYLTVTVTDLRTGGTETLDAAGLAAHRRLGPGRWKVCASVAESLAFRHTVRCRTRTLARRVSAR